MRCLHTIVRLPADVSDALTLGIFRDHDEDWSVEIFRGRSTQYQRMRCFRVETYEVALHRRTYPSVWPLDWPNHDSPA